MKSPAVLMSLLALFGSCANPPDARRLREPVPALEGLEEWLAAREALVPGLKPGAAAGVVWADGRVKTAVALVYLPGYTATRGEIHPVTERMARQLGANVFYARPTGQGMAFEGHRTVRAEDWAADSLEAYEIGTRLGDRVVIVATSTGATEAVNLILGPAKIVPAATIAVSPNLTPMNRQSETLLWPGGDWLLSMTSGQTMSYPPQNELHARIWDTTHHTHSLIPMMQTVQQARKQDFGGWPSPVLVVYDPEDDVVDEAVTVKLFSQAPAGVVEFLEWRAAEGDDHHVLAGEALSPGGTDRLVEAGTAFLKRVLGL